MSRYKKPFPSARPQAQAKKQTPVGLVIALAAAGGVVVGSAGTYVLSRPIAPKQSAPPAASGTPQAQVITPPQQQFTPAPQPPGEAPPGKVWSVEHGHWHDAPVVLTNPALTTVTSAPATTTPTPASATVTPAVTTNAAPPPATTPTTTPTPAVVPPEKKE
jgi:hypothetical protein